jgi:aspartate/methionine/tyrosine aminotransferase
MVQVATIAESMPGALKLCYGESDSPTPPFICDAATSAMRAGHTFYTHTSGCLELRQAIADKVHELHQVRYSTSEIMATTGATLAVYAAIRAFVGRGDNAVIVSPAYALFANAVLMAGGTPRFAPLALTGRRFYLDLNRVADAIDAHTRMLIVNSPSNPTGWVISEEEQRAVVDLAERHDLVVLADEVYERLVYDPPKDGSPQESPGPRPVAAPSFARVEASRDRLIVVNSFSKTYNMTGWRLGWAQTSERTIKTMYKAVEFMTSNPAAMVQQAGVVALRDGERYITELRASYSARREQAIAALTAMPGVFLPDPQGAFYVFPKLDAARDSSAFTTRLVRDTGVGGAPGRAAFGADGEGHVRICFAASEGLLTEAFRRIGRYLDA